jgi:hypothetical protein
VIIDGQKIGTLGNGEELSFDLIPGEHTVQIEAGTMGSPEPLHINLAPNTSAALECGISQQYCQSALKRSGTILAGVALAAFFVNGLKYLFISFLMLAVASITFFTVSVLIITIEFQPGKTYFLKNVTSDQ